jgi:mannose-6-phosphate isomerase
MSRPSIELRAPIQVGKRAWGHELLIAQTDHYIGKVLEMYAGTAGGLQLHREKIETFYLHDGEAWVDYDQHGTLTRLLMLPGMIVHVPAGAPHRVTAITNCVFFECSTPVFNDRVRLEKEYGEPEVGGLPTTVPDATGHS